MRNGARISVIIPAMNEEEAIGKVVAAIPEWVDETIVVDNGSTDDTAQVARSRGARVVVEPRRGYGSACLRGIADLREADVVVFLDGDFSDHPEEMPRLVDPVIDGDADMVIGSRVRGRRQAGALTPQQRFGNWLACLLMRFFWHVRYTDLGPFRAISARALRRAGMRDPDYGWTVEMQVKAARKGLRGLEVPVSYRRRIGRSKVSGTVSGVIGAGTKILGTIFAEAIEPRLLGRRGGRGRLIVFTRWPEAGMSKTRLAGVLGSQGAADLQRMMTEHMLATARQFAASSRVVVEVRYAGGGASRMRRWLGAGVRYAPQERGDLGERMHAALQSALSEGAERAVLIGTDCPDIDTGVLSRAFEALGKKELVLGPAADGGYYLVGLTRPAARLFDGIRWGTNEVLQQTLERSREANLPTSLVDRLHDVDRPEDLPVWELGAGAHLARISVIVPALNAEATLERTLSNLAPSRFVEVIVVDGGSEDATVKIARAHGVKVLRAERSRARQMNVGAREATGDVLVFLHADTQLPDGFGRHVRQVLGRQEVAAGAFELAIDAPGALLKIIERATNLRGRRFRTPYGDQALFMSRDTFRELGGFRDMPLMEDLEIVRRLRRRGRIGIARAPAMTSARRWLRLGPMRATLINWFTAAGYLLGVSPERLARWYYSL